MEATLLSTPISFINSLESEGNAKAVRLKKYKENIDRPLAAILSINTIAHTIGAAGVGAQVTRLWGNEWFGVASAILTLLILIFTEIIPKTVGATYWRKMALTSTTVLHIMIIITYPFVLISEYLMKIIGKNSNEATVSREEVSAMVEIAAEEGEVEKTENKIIQNVMRLESVKVEDVMTPQIVVSIAPETMCVADFYKNKEFLHHARIPVFIDNDEDHITGYVLRQAVLENVANDNFEIKLSEIRRDIVIAEEGQSLFALWETLIEAKEHIALIVDEYGSFTGIVTLEDIIESVFGLEIVDETDDIVDMQQYARNKWRERKEAYKHIVEDSSSVSKLLENNSETEKEGNNDIS